MWIWKDEYEELKSEIRSLNTKLGDMRQDELRRSQRKYAPLQRIKLWFDDGGEYTYVGNTVNLGTSYYTGFGVKKEGDGHTEIGIQSADGFLQVAWFKELPALIEREDLPVLVPAE